jgi:hypothetical protein
MSTLNEGKISAPPLQLSLLDNGTSFALQCSVPAMSQIPKPQNIMSFWTSRYARMEEFRLPGEKSRYLEREHFTDLCGAFSFTDGLTDGFIVLWGITDTRKKVMIEEPKDFHSWWESDHYRAYCSVHSWSSVAGRGYSASSKEDESLVTDRTFYDFLLRLYPRNAGRSTQKPDTYTTRIDSERDVTAKIAPMEFLDRKCLQLTVEVV